MQHRHAAPRRGSAAGVTLAEALVAVAITSILVVGLLTVLQGMTRTHERGEKAALSQQEVRNAFDTLVKQLRFVGFDYDRDGLETPYPGQPDEQVEFAGATALTIRGNFDFEDANGGRELALETSESDPDFEEVCCPIVTTGNDEIVTFALRSESASKNLDEIELKVDVQPATGRDAFMDVDGPVNEETVTIERVDFSNENPPYELIRFTIDPTGTRVEERVLARNVRSLEFRYEDSAGNPHYCKTGAPPCAGSDQVRFDTVGGGDDLVANDGLGREARASIRQIGVSLVGMEDKPDLRYVDPDADLSNPAEAAVAKYRKFELDASVTPPNLGSRGRRDTDSVAPEVVTNVTACVGHCAAVRVEWNEAKRASSYLVQLYDPTTTPPTMLFSGNAGAQEIPNTNPQRLYTAFDSHHDVQIQDGVSVYAVVTAQNSAGSSEPSIASDTVTLVDLVRPEAPLELNASGYEESHPDWPDTSGSLQPVSDPTDDDYPREGGIAVRWSQPLYALDVQDPKNPATTWDTRVGSSTLPALACDAVPAADLDGNGSLEHQRTPLRELSWGQRYLIFRSTDPRFVPTADDLIAVTNGQRNSVTGQLEYVDVPKHEYDGTGNFVRTVNDLSCCTTYYYRMRAVDACWAGGDPASTSDPHLSPFTPPLNTGDVPDSDDWSTLSPSEVGLAVPGYAIPAAAPAAPADLRYSEFDSDTKSFRWSFVAPKVDAAPAPGPNQAVYREYVLWSHGSNPENRLDAFANGQNGGKVEARITVSDTGALNVDGGYVTVGDAATRLYRVAAVQCLDDYVANEAGDPYALDVGEGSTAVKIPCNFGGGPLTFTDVDSSSFPTAVVATMVPEDPAVTLARGRLILSDPVSAKSVSTPAPGLEPAVAGGYQVIFNSSDIAALFDQMPAGVDLDISVDFKDSQGCFVQSAPQTLALQPPDCCFEQDFTLVSVDSADGFTWSIPITTICGAEVAITSMDLLLASSSKFEQLWWNGVPIWTGSNANAVADLSLTPLIVPAGTTPVLRAQTSKDIRGDALTFDLTQEMLGNSGSCNFSEYDVGQAPLDCCLKAPSQPLWYDAGTDWIGQVTVTEVCGTSIELSYLDLWKNQGKYEQIDVDGVTVWTGSTPDAYADLSASPPVIAPGGTATITLHASTSWSGDSFTLDVGFGAGHCLFSQVNIP